MRQTSESGAKQATIGADRQGVGAVAITANRCAWLASWRGFPLKLSKPPRPARGTAKSAAVKRLRAPVTATVAFRGTDALVSLTPPAELVTVWLDGAALAPERWRVTEDGTVRVACPPESFDGTPHVLRLAFADADPVEHPYRSRYRTAIERIDDTDVRGWIFDELRPTSSLALIVRSGAAEPFSVINTIDDAALKAAHPQVIAGGFAIRLPPRAVRGEPELLAITVSGTDYMPFGPILRGTTLPAAVATASLARRPFGASARGLLYGARLLPAMVRGLADSVSDASAHGAVRLAGRQGMPRLAPPLVDVIVPVYRGRAETLACLESVLASGDRIAHRVVVIDDASPEPELSQAMRALADAGRVIYLRNETNLGFVATANRGLALSADADVVLLNSDTVVPSGFLDRLYRAAHADAAIATATPLSNNATICSLPHPPGIAALPYGLGLAEIDALVRKANAGVVRDIPTAHGFCMFITRAALDDVGPFDAATFGAGYGEENDFSLRALQRGWRNVCAADVFVEHKGALSFADTRQALIAANLAKVEALYPYYHDLVADFLRTDPMHDVRNAVQKAAWRRIGRIVLFVTLSLEGGAVRHGDDMMRRLTGEGFLVVALAMGRDHDRRPMVVVRRWDSDEQLTYPQPAPIGEALADILDLAPMFIHVQHLLDLPDGVGEFVHDCGIPYAVTLHDFFYGCPRVTLLDGGDVYCGIPPAAKCTACIRQSGSHELLHRSLEPFARTGEVWRAKWGALLRDAFQVIAPSHDTAARYGTLFPGLRVDVKPHFAPPAENAPKRRVAASGGARLRVAVPGAIGRQKGVRPLVDLARHCSRWEDDITLVVVGHTDRDSELEAFGNVSLAGGYEPARANAALCRSGCKVALFLSIFPETFSYTLSEALEAGMVPVAYDFGAIGERLRALGVGELVPPGCPPEMLVAAIRRARAGRVTLPPAAIWAEYGTLFGDYYAKALTDLAEVIPPPDVPRVLAWPSGVARDGWCGAEVRLQVWSPTPIARVAVAFSVPSGGGLQAVEISWDGAGDGQVLARAFMAENEVTRVVCALPASGLRLADLACRFDFLVGLAPPDIRRVAGMFVGVEVSQGAGWRSAELPDIAAQAPPPP
jgi:GT2 family glycosyltransferase/glycosyltransferase involved in cell wall biosynthesis